LSTSIGWKLYNYKYDFKTYTHTIGATVFKTLFKLNLRCFSFLFHCVVLLFRILVVFLTIRIYTYNYYYINIIIIILLYIILYNIYFYISRYVRLLVNLKFVLLGSHPLEGMVNLISGRLKKWRNLYGKIPREKLTDYDC